MSALPILVQTVSAKRAIHAYIEHGAHPDQLVRDQAKRAADKAVLRVVRNEPEQPEPCQFCAVERDDAEPPVTLPELVLLTAKGVAWIACALSVGLGFLWLCDVAGHYFGSHV